MSTGRVRGRGRGTGLAAPNTISHGTPTVTARGRGGRLNNGMRPAGTANRGGFTANGHTTAFGAGKPSRGNAPSQASRTTSHTGAASNAVADMDARWQALRLARDQERKDAIRKGLMSDPDKPMRLSEAITPVGTCRSMCAEYERVQRAVQRDVWDEEKNPNRSPSATDQEAMDEGRMVKKFRRSAAGDETQLPSDLRPPPVLKQTCDYLFHTILGEAPLPKVHHFVWDRTRAIRNDFSIQQLTKADDLSIAIECFERIARFHILSLHQLALAEKPYAAYNAQQEREQLDKTLLSLMQYYDDCRGRFPLPHEAEFRAYCVLFQLQDATPDLEDRVQNWPRGIATDRRVQQALKVYSAACNTWDAQGPFTGTNATPHVVARQDWDKFWQLIKSSGTSYLMSCVAEIYFNLVRKMVLNAIIRTTRVKTAGPPNTEWTLTAMTQLFYFDDDEELEDFCGHFGLQFEDLPDGSDRYLDISSITNRTLPQADGHGPSQLKSYLVERKRERRTLAAVIDGLSVREARDQGQLLDEVDDEGEVDGMYDEQDGEEMEDAGGEGEEEEEEEEEDTLFVPEAKLQSSAPPASKLSFGQPTSTGFFGKASSATPSVPAQAVPAAPAFAQPTSNSSPFTKAVSGFGQQSQPINPFAAAAGGVGKSQSNNPFQSAASKTLFTQTTAPEKAGLGDSTISVAKSGGIEAPKPMFGSEGASKVYTNSFPSLFSTQTPSSGITGPTAGSLFSQKEQTIERAAEHRADASSSNATAGQINPFASSATPTFAFHPFSAADQNLAASQETEQKTSSQLGQPFNAAATPAPSQPVQPEAKSSPAAQSPPSTHSTTATSPPQPSTSAAQTGSSSPPRRLSALDTKPKRPSPLSNSFTASEEASGDGASTQPPVQQPKTHFASPRQVQPLASPAIRPETSASEFDAIVTRLAQELVEDPTTGYLKQYLEFCVRGLITEVQEKVYLERINQEADDFRHFCLQDKYGKRWRELSRTRRLRRQQAERRKRQQRRLQASQDQEMGGTVSVLDGSSLRSSRAGSNIAQSKPSKQAMVDAMFQSTNGGSRYGADRQARAGSKRTAESIDGSSIASSREPGHKRAKSISHEPGNGAMMMSTTDGDSGSDVLKRSSFLGFSLAGEAAQHASTSTTKSTYFRMKAMGLKPNRDVRTGAERGVKRSRSDSIDTGSPRLNASTLSRLDTNQDRDHTLMPPPSTRSVRSKTDEDDEALFARLRAAREALKESESFMRVEVAKEEGIRRSRSTSHSDNESSSMQRARAEARLRSSANSDLGTSVNSRDVPAYRLRESKFVPREQYAKAIERASEIRASRSAVNSRPSSRTEDHQAAFGDMTDQNNSSSSHQPFLIGLGDTSDSSFGTSACITPFEQSAPASNHSETPMVPGSGLQSTKAPNPFSQSSSFAPVSNGVNPFLQDSASSNGNGQPRVPATSNPPEQCSHQATDFASFRSTDLERDMLAPSSEYIEQPAAWSFATAQDGPDDSNDHTIPPSEIPEALAASFAHQDSARESPFAQTSKASNSPRANSYMPSQAASAAISLMSDDEDEAGETDAAFGQAQFFNQVASAAASNGVNGVAASASSLNASVNKFAALADFDEDGIDQGEDDESERRSSRIANEIEVGDEEDNVLDPGSHMNGPPLAEDDLEEDDEEDAEDDASDLQNGHYMHEDSDDAEDGYADGDIEDEGDMDEEGEEYDEDDEESDGALPAGRLYANGYQNHYGHQVYAAAAQPLKRQVNEALQQVGNDENEPIELSD